MSVTVGDLLERLQAIATVVSAEPSTVTPYVESHEAGWRGLARHVERALVALPFQESSVGQQTRLVAVGVLRAINAAAGGVRPEGVGAGHLEDAALVVGGIADVLAGQRAPFRVDRQPAWLPASDARPRRWSETPFQPVFTARPVSVASATGLQSSLLAAIHVFTQWSLRTVGENRASPLSDALHELAALSEPHLWLAPAQRRSALESVTSTPWWEVSLLGAAQRWAHEAEGALHRRLVTSGTVAMMASDLAILNATILRAVRVQAADPLVWERVAQDLIQARAAWKALAEWPADLRLGGAPPAEFIRTSRELRAAVAADFRGPDGWLTARELAPRIPSASLDSIAWSLAEQATWVGDALSRTLQEVALGSGRLWVASDLVHPTPKQDTPQLDPVEGTGAALGNAPWSIPLHPVAHAEQAVQTAADAARHTRRVAQHLESLYPVTSVPETVARLTIAGRRAHAQAVTPLLGRDHTRGPAR